MKYDYLVVGSGLYGAVFAHEAKKKGKTCLVIDKRPHIGGNIYCEKINGINVHKYGAHIFHTSDKEIWEYVNQFCEFNNYVNSPIANYKGELYNMPFNMNTFSKLWGIVTPDEAKAKIETVYNAKKEEDIILKYNDFETTISQDILETNYDLDKAVNEAISLGKDGNIITNNYNILFALLGKKNIKVDMSINEEQIKDEIENIQTNIPGTIIEPDYYVENDKLIITPGQEGIKISVDNLINRIKNTLKTSSSNQQYIEIPMDNVWPDKIDIEKIHDEIYKEVQDAYLTENPIII